MGVVCKWRKPGVWREQRRLPVEIDFKYSSGN
jgi:hypothetical protein